MPAFVRAACSCAPSAARYAAHAGVSRQLVARIEAGHPTGEVAAVVVAAALGYILDVYIPSTPTRHWSRAKLEGIPRSCRLNTDDMYPWDTE
jgi:hypothetical protein